MKERLINAAKETYYFISSRIFLKNFSKAMLGLVCFFLITFQGLKFYTNHGESVSVPNFKGQTLRQITAQLKKSNLNIQIIDSSSYQSDKLPLTIIEQVPLPTVETGLKVKENRTIYLTVNPISPPSKALPKIWDKDEAVAKKILNNNGFRTKTRERVPDKAINTVLEVYVNGKKLNRNDKNLLKSNSLVELVIADGGGSTMEVPNLLCRKFSEAKFQLEGSNLNVIIVNIEGLVADESSAYVYKQNPMPDSNLSLTVGDEVSVWLTEGLPPGCMDDTGGLETNDNTFVD
jgi:beta-lactam-binding protein with PASTA domain